MDSEASPANAARSEERGTEWEGAVSISDARQHAAENWQPEVGHAGGGGVVGAPGPVAP